ncbi:MAG TPA: type II toxin-antitoxin system Phd/YefM family antitoxin [Vicinamibacteria bacterium]|nr:type II toxin-antitoxin system Phd/YefM family antitoxin [Vicinamibacteria bacterium]
MKIAPLAEVKARFSRYVEESERGPIVVTKNGRPVAVIISPPDEDELERLVLAHTPRFQRLMKAAEERLRETGVKHDEFWEGVMGEEPRPETPAKRSRRQRKKE